MTTTIAEQVHHLAETMATQPPYEVMDAFAQEQAVLSTQGVPPGVVEVGGVLPDASLLDPHGAAASLTAPSDGARAAQLQLGLDLSAINAGGTIRLSMPTTLIVDADQAVRWIDVHPDCTIRSEPEQALAALAVP